MAFSERVKAHGEELLQCGICRQPIREGRRIRSADYKFRAPVCQHCYQAYFLNRQAGMDVGYTDDTARSNVWYRPAEPLERDPLFRRNEPPCGYEHPFPDLPVSQIVRDTAFWILFCIGIRLILHLESDAASGARSISASVLDVAIPVGSLIWSMRYLYQLIRGILYGMGYTRQLVLLTAIIAQLTLSWLCRTGMLLW